MPCSWRSRRTSTPGHAETRSDGVVAPARALRARDVADSSSARASAICSRNQGWRSVGKVLVVEALPRRRRACFELTRAVGLQERLAERPADAHRLADGLHLRPERRVGAGELLEREARELDDDVVERRLEARGRRLREVVRDLVERVADGELRCDLRDRVAGRLRGERGRARDARVHLDDAQLAGLAVARELDVRAAGLDARPPGSPRPRRREAPGRPRRRASSAARP